MVAPSAHEPDQDTPAICFRVLTACAGSAAAFGGVFAQHHGSRLFSLKLPFARSPATPFLAPPAFERFHATCPVRVSFPARAPLLSAFRRVLARFILLKSAGAARAVLMRSSN